MTHQKTTIECAHLCARLEISGQNTKKMAREWRGVSCQTMYNWHKSGRNLEHVEFATLEWVDWFNNKRLLKPIGDIPPREFEQHHYDQREARPLMAGLN